ncbi:hypothetical protein HMPREF0671_01780 [Prevotella sp. S7 MS 2]|nr:hypothetical protein HMPREF0671_01780 [Prevotella sp. S7 MS 2]
MLGTVNVMSASGAFHVLYLKMYLPLASLNVSILESTFLSNSSSLLHELKKVVDTKVIAAKNRIIEILEIIFLSI